MTVIGVEAKKLGFIWYPGGRLWCRQCDDYYVPIRYDTGEQIKAMSQHRMYCSVIAWRDLNTST